MAGSSAGLPAAAPPQEPQSTSGHAQEAMKTPAKVTTITDTPYFTPAQCERLQVRARGHQTSAAKWEQTRMAACSFMAAIGAKLGCPQRTIGTAQMLYLRFHLFYPPAEFSMHEVACACIFTATKLNDTQKRVYDVVLASYALRYPDLLTPPPGAASGDWIAHATVPEMDMDMDAIQQEQTRLVSLERLLLQISRHDADLLWRTACDSHRTYAPLLYPPPTVACGCVYATAAMMYVHDKTTRLADLFAEPRTSLSAWSTSMDAVQDVALHLLQLYSMHAPSLVSDVRSDRAVPLHVTYPPPMSLLAWATQSPKETLLMRITQAQIWIRQQPMALGPHEQRVRLARNDDTLPSTMYSAHPDESGRSVATRYILLS
ncbi:beta-glucosidase [Malassezia equina]|uniref:Beta-glucosidase n=1 Tax=Malassezia equina TaxID=1381935 RepID=A0AAF0EGQ4_9BASI|nr:beta-glucosidase [Malassezia equina]